MTVPCSFWCRPEEGVHVILTYFRDVPDSEINQTIGWAGKIEGNPESCIDGKWAVTIALEPAREAPPPPPGYPRPFLTTERIIDNPR